MDLFSSNSLLMLEKSASFLWTKQAALSDNVANAETPNYKAKIVTFEESLTAKLEKALAGAKPKQAVRGVLEGTDFAVVERQDALRMDENGVNTTEQMVEAVRTAYQMRYVYNSIGSDLAMLRSAIRGQ